MNAKLRKVLSYALCTSAFSQRNVTSIALVIIFLFVYVLAGGKITTALPSVKSSKDFGIPKNVKLNKSEKSSRTYDEIMAGDKIPDLSREESKEILGELPSDKAKKVYRKRAKFGTLFTEEERREAEGEKIDEDGLVEGVDFTSRREKWMLERSEKKPEDSLSKIEERLKIRRR
jgi:hypothetical protein